jgi:uncharacterized protein
MEDKIKADLKNAMLAKDETKVSSLRLLSSEITYSKVAKGLKNSDEKLTDEDIIPILRKEIKKRKEAASGFRSGNREESALKEEAEAKVLEGYLPDEMGDEELTKLVQEAITNVGASSMQDMGKVIGLVMGKVGGSVDGGRVSALVKSKLS